MASPVAAGISDYPTEQFSALEGAGVRHIFVRRIPGIDVSHDKSEALRRLDAAHRRVRESIGLGDRRFVTAEQVHGNKIAIVDAAPNADAQMSGCDGLITNVPGVALGVYVADCCAVYLVDPKVPAIGLVHSGRKGTELNIMGEAIEQMRAQFGTKASDLIVQLSPCIRPPHYENDFAAEIVRQARSRGVQKIYDSGTCTACDLDLYYSYRAAKGKTGRMLAVLGLTK